jgi:hypothetical protein
MSLTSHSTFSCVGHLVMLELPSGTLQDPPIFLLPFKNNLG